MLLIIVHAPSPNTQRVLNAIQSGAHHADIKGVDIRCIAPLDAQPEDVLAADGIILGTPENLGYMSGALKDFFDRVYYPCLEKKQGLPYALVIRAGHDGTGTRRAVESIASGLRWKAVQPPLLLKGDFNECFISQCKDLGLYMAAGLESGIF